MSLQEKLSLLTVFLSIIIVFVLAIWGIFRETVEGFKVIEKETNKVLLWIRRTMILLAGVGLLCFGYAAFIEPYWIEVRQVEVKSSKIRDGSKPIRVVHISDIHSEEYVGLEESLPLLIAEQKPDLIVFSGDSLNSKSGLGVFRSFLTKVSEIAPTFVVRGNWDVWYWNTEDLFGGLNVKELNGKAEKLEVRGIPVWIAGIYVGSEGKLIQSLNGIPKNDLSIFVTHYPDLIENSEIKEFEPDLYCAGHTHGGQVAMPIYGALVTFSKLGKKYEGGTYQVGKTTLNVNRGIGMEGGITPRVRFWARPEVTVIDIVSN